MLKAVLFIFLFGVGCWTSFSLDLNFLVWYWVQFLFWWWMQYCVVYAWCWKQCFVLGVKCSSVFVWMYLVLIKDLCLLFTVGCSIVASFVFGYKCAGFVSLLCVCVQFSLVQILCFVFICFKFCVKFSFLSKLCICVKCSFVSKLCVYAKCSFVSKLCVCVKCSCLSKLRVCAKCSFVSKLCVCVKCSFVSKLCVWSVLLLVSSSRTLLWNILYHLVNL